MSSDLHSSALNAIESIPSKKGNVPENSDETESTLMLVNKVKDLNEKLSASLAESDAKDDLVRHHTKDAEEAVSGWEKAKAEAISLKQELDAAHQQRYAAEDRVSHLDGALKECMQHLRFVREEKEQAIHDAVMKKARELDVIRIELEENLAETRQRLLEAGAENGEIHKSLQEAIRSLEELKVGKSQAEAEVNLLQIRLSSLEEENAGVKYELCVLEKELEIRNEEGEYNRKSTCLDGASTGACLTVPEILSNICDLLCFCVLHHSYRIK